MRDRWQCIWIGIAAVMLMAPAVVFPAAAAEERLSEQDEAVIRGYFIHMIERADAAIERLEKISQRTQSRISRMRVDDTDRERVQAERDAAEAKRREAQAALENLKLRLERTRSDPDPRAAFRKARRLVGEVKDEVKDAHAALLDAVRLLKQSLDTSDAG